VKGGDGLDREAFPMSDQNGFTKNADLYRTSDAHSEMPDLESAAEHMPSVGGLSGLDVATGTGHTAFFFARKQAHMFAVDINDEMLRVAQEESDRLTLRVRFLKSPADDLMFDDDTFDFVSCRLAAHHFENIPGFLSEVGRVLRENGSFLLIDNVVPEGAEGEWMNSYEQQRDPSHVACLTEKEWKALLTGAGFSLTHSERFKKNIDYSAWMERMGHVGEAGDELWEELSQAPEEVRNYWNPRVRQGSGRTLTLHRRIYVTELIKAP